MATINKRSALIFGILSIGVGLALSQALPFGRQPNKAKAPAQLPLVSVTTVQTCNLPIEFAAQGHLVPLNQVDVRPQMSGIIRAVHFREGEQVKAGQLLFTLDDSDAGAQLRRVQAQAAQIQAQLDDARRVHRRATELIKSNFISPSAVDTEASKVDSLQAQLKATLADIELARVQMGRTRITAPIAAQTGALAVHPGSLAQQNAGAPLVTLAQFDPIGMEFSLPEQFLGTILAARADGAISVTLDGPNGQSVDGKLTFINNTINADTGTINLKASFPNAMQKLWPGAFARVSLHAGIDRDAIVVAPQAILEGPNGRFVYLVGSDGKVSPKPVTLLRINQNAAVIAGLSGGERVVLDGNQNLRAGMAVRILPQQAGNALPASNAGKQSK